MDTTFIPVPKVVNGSIAGIVGVTCVFPIDLVKTRLQRQEEGVNRQYKNLIDCARQTYRRQGFFGMYKGSAVNLLLITPEKVIKLVGNDFFRHILRKDKSRLTFGREMLAGGGAGMCQVIITTPMELLKIQMQLQGDNSGGNVAASSSLNKTAAPKLSATKVAMELWREKGFFGLYRGFRVTLLRDVTFSAIYFPLFAHLNAQGKKREGSDQAVFYHSFISGCIAGSVASLSVTPIDVVKTRLQKIEKAAGEKTYTGIVDCFRKILTHENATALFKGGFCRVLVIAPLFGIAQTVYYLGVAEYLLGYPPP